MLYDIETEVPAFVYITPANIHDSKAMPGEVLSSLYEPKPTCGLNPRQGVSIRYANWRIGKLQGEVDIAGLDIARQNLIGLLRYGYNSSFQNNPNKHI